jgi:hypothetical protein
MISSKLSGSSHVLGNATINILTSADLLLPTKTEFHVMTHKLSSFVTFALSPYNAMGIAVPA